MRCATAQSAPIEHSVDERGLSSKLELTRPQREAIYQVIHNGRRKAGPTWFAGEVGSGVLPIIDLFTLPDELLAANPEIRNYNFTEVDDRIVLVDPSTRRVIAVIGPRVDF
jgi:hypothetical protein